MEHVRIGEGHRSQLGLPGEPAAELVVAEVRPGRRVPGEGRSHQVMLKVADARALSRRPRLAAPPWSIRCTTGSTASGRPR